MRCPIDLDTDMKQVEKKGIVIDYCPKCGGVFLNKGELEKLISEASAAAAPVEDDMAPDLDFMDNSQAKGSRPQPKPAGNTHSHKKREGFLGEIFDFDIF
ncbi:MAG: zf-TFIIB domain-containing protein [Candidatus Doudnabacteria bacterium]|nr:zf-TFIIB domain-containing protein [Candidatus Doudnabacteria bacterium]